MKQYNHIARALYKEAQAGRPYAIPLREDKEFAAAQEVLGHVRQEFSGETLKSTLCRSKTINLHKPLVNAVDIPLRAYVSFRHEKVARAFARAMRGCGHDVPLFETDSSKPRSKALHSYSVQNRRKCGSFS